MKTQTRTGERIRAAALVALAGTIAGCAAPSARPAADAGGPDRAMETIDRSVPPEPGPVPGLDLPPVRRHRLSNGLPVLIVERDELPVVDLQLVVRTGAAEDPPPLAGRASLTADLLDGGTEHHDALALADTLDVLGAELETRTGWDATTIALHVLTPRLGPALDLMADVVLRPRFPAEEVRRRTEERIAERVRQRDDPAVQASRAFARAVYGGDHPYGLPADGTEATLRRLERADLTAFHEAHYRPNNAFVVAVGDVDAASLIPRLERAFGDWKAAAVPDARVPAAPDGRATTIHLIDRPDAEQSEVRVGHAAVPRTSDEYFPLVVMNTVLGGSFASRLNTKLREENGFAYGARSTFDFRAGAGPFVASSAVFTDVTDSALVALVREIRRIREAPVPDAELRRARNYVALGLPRSFEATGDVADHIREAELYGLGADYFDRYVDRVQGVSARAVREAARAHLDPGRLTIVVVGDRQRIQPRLEALDLGPVVVRETS